MTKVLLFQIRQWLAPSGSHVLAERSLAHTRSSAFLPASTLFIRTAPSPGELHLFTWWRPSGSRRRFRCTIPYPKFQIQGARFGSKMLSELTQASYSLQLSHVRIFPCFAVELLMYLITGCCPRPRCRYSVNTQSLSFLKSKSLNPETHVAPSIWDKRW